MTWIDIIVLIVAGLFLCAFVLGLVGMFTTADPVPMSPDEEYRWLTKANGLTHDEALDVMMRLRGDLNRVLRQRKG